MNHIYRVIFNTTAQTQQTASELAKTQSTRSSQSAKTITAIAIATALSLLSSHALADGGRGGVGYSIANGGAGGVNHLSTAGGDGALTRNTYGGFGGGGAGRTGGNGGFYDPLQPEGAGATTAGGSGADGFDDDDNLSIGGGGGAHGFVGAALPTTATTGGNGGNGGNSRTTTLPGRAHYGGAGGGAGAYGAVITAAVHNGTLAHNITGGVGGNGGAAGGIGGDGGSGGHGLVLQYGGTLRINRNVTGGNGGKGGLVYGAFIIPNRGNGGNGGHGLVVQHGGTLNIGSHVTVSGGNGGDGGNYLGSYYVTTTNGNGGNGIHVPTAGSSLHLTLQNGAIIRAGSPGNGIGGSKQSYAIRFNSGINSLTLHDDVQIQGIIDGRSGNNDTINVRGKDIRTMNIFGIETLHFEVQDYITAGDTLLSVFEHGLTYINNISLGLASSNTSLNQGDRITLITKIHGGYFITPALNNINAVGSDIATLYDFKLINPHGGALQAELMGISLNPQVKSLSEARLAGMDFVNRGADLAANTGLENLVQATQNDGIQGFAAIAGGKTRTQTGSHIDVNGVHLMLGVGTQLPNASGTLTLGGFIEGGRGSYDSYNDFANRPDVHASGDTHYYGVGLLAKQQFNNQWFIDGGLRLGKSHMDYFSSDLVDGAGNPTSFSGNSNYWGVNIGVGKDIELNEKNRLTPYAKLAYTHSSGDSQTIAGSTFDFSAMNSLRSRVGVRWTHQLNETSQFYTDAAWEHEFQGTAKGQVLGFAMPEPSLHGDTGIVNVGVNFTPNENLTIGVGAQGEFGKRNGVSATAKVTYSF